MRSMGVRPDLNPSPRGTLIVPLQILFAGILIEPFSIPLKEP